MASISIDLHTHTTVSDGSDTPAQLVASAVSAGVDVIGLTDHDSTAGWQEALGAAQDAGLGVVPGVELSAQILDDAGDTPPLSVHVLGYGIDPHHPRLSAELEKIRSHRDDRLRRMVERLALDLDISWEEVSQHIAPGATAGRPHIAEVLVEKGIVADVSEAFEHYLAAHGPYHVPHYAPRLRRAIESIVDAGGVPILAHPLSGGRRFALDQAHDQQALTRQLQQLADWGLAGVEIHHRENAPHLVEQLRNATVAAGLIRTGSSDYHGSKKPNRLGEHLTDPDQLEAILAQATGHPWLPPKGHHH